jgi:hypothetical protein
MRHYNRRAQGIALLDGGNAVVQEYFLRILEKDKAGSFFHRLHKQMCQAFVELKLYRQMQKRKLQQLALAAGKRRATFSLLRCVYICMLCCCTGCLPF